MKIVMKQFLLIFLITPYVVSCQAGTEIYAPLYKCTAKLNNPYGICSHINRKGIHNEFDTRDIDVAMISSAGASFVRTDFDWNVCQPEINGPFDFKQHLSMMKSIAKKNLHVIGILWPKVPSRTFTQYEEYIQRNVALYKKNIKYWEVVNEADQMNKRQEDFSPESYVRMLRVANRIIKKENKNAKVLLSSIDIYKDSFYEEVFKAGVVNDFDILNIHLYVNKDTQPEGLIGYFKWVQMMSSKYGIDKPVWLTETGCTTVPTYGTEEIQAQRLPRMFVISFALGVDKVFWYKSRSCELSEDNGEYFHGLWHKDYTPKPAFYAYQTLTRMCPNKATRPRLQRNDGVYVASWKRPDGKKVCALWTSGNSVRVNLGINKEYNAYSIYGREIRITPDDFEVSQSVVYIVGTENFKLKRL